MNSITQSAVKVVLWSCYVLLQNQSERENVCLNFTKSSVVQTHSSRDNDASPSNVVVFFASFQVFQSGFLLFSKICTICFKTAIKRRLSYPFFRRFHRETQITIARYHRQHSFPFIALAESISSEILSFRVIISRN